MLGEIALWSFVVLLLTGVFLTLWFQPSHGRGPVRRLLRPAPGHPHVPGLRVHARHLVRRARWPAGAPDAPLVRDAVHRRDVRAHDARLPHRRLPQAARAQLGDRRPADPDGHPRGLRRLLAARRPALRHGHADRRRPGQGDAGGRLVHVVLHVRRRVPRRSDHPAALHRPRAADPGSDPGVDRCPHAAARLPQAHPVARSRPHREERRGLPDAPGVRRQGRRVLLHRLRRDRADGWPARHQPGVEVRPLRPVEGDGRLAARLVHGHRRGPVADHARLGDAYLGHDLVLERPRAGPGRSRSCCSRSCSRGRSSRRG